jgi:protein subunit release factor A
MEEKERQLRTEFADLEARLSDPNIYSDQSYPKLAKRRTWLEQVVNLFDTKKQLTSEREQAAKLAGGNDELAELAQLELGELDARIATNSEALAEALTPKDPNDEKDVIVEIRAAVGSNATATRWNSSAKALRKSAVSRKSSSQSAAKIYISSSNLKPASTACSVYQAPKARAASIPLPSPFRYCPRPKKPMSKSTPTTYA